MTGVELHHAATTDVGLVREVNEDAYLAAPPLFVVADGMGGHDRGDVAAAIVVEEFGRLAARGYDPARGQAVVAETLRTCRARIAAYDDRERAAGAVDFHAGTTAVVALLVEDDPAQRRDGEGQGSGQGSGQGGAEPQWLVANLGDSRAYRFADGVLEQVSTDHSLVQELVESGAITPTAAAVHPERNVVTRALGGQGQVDADYFVVPLSAVPRLLLCSDGVSGMMDDDRIASVLASNDDPRDAADALVAAALAAGGEDNATALVVDVVALASDDPERPPVSLEEKRGSLS